MKVVLIHGQNHKGSSYHIGRMIADKMQESNEIQEFFLPKDLNHFCLGCYNCIEDDAKCPFYGEKRKIMDAVETADVLIFTTPTYCMHASAPMKSFIDLTFSYWMVHRPRKCMFSKRAVVVSAAAGTGMKSAIKDITNTLFYWGVPYIRSYGVAVQAMSWDGVSEKKKAKIDKDTAKLARKLSVGKKPWVGIKTRFMFKVMGGMQSAGMGSSPVEKEYWEQNGWFGKKRPWRE
ncbi:MAG: NAD(P)H-dependent oxidoreductase [Lachnospiraceae bacterium]|nr:NAD(P)H-dependent oxidoreductase [Lachnospiraceae bacterium]